MWTSHSIWVFLLIPYVSWNESNLGSGFRARKETNPNRNFVLQGPRFGLPNRVFSFPADWRTAPELAPFGKQARGANIQLKPCIVISYASSLPFFQFLK